MENRSTTHSRTGLATDYLEILPTALLLQAQPLVEEFRQLSHSLRIKLGWSYLLDLSWAAQQLASLTSGMRVLDAGAGRGVIQWWLADHGVDVISADRLSRRDLQVRFRQRYQVQGWRHGDLAPLARPRLRDFLPSSSPRRWPRYPRKLATSLDRLMPHPADADRTNKGTVFVYNQDLTSLPDIEDASVDAIVSISALEHNSPDDLRTCVAELLRVLKPGGRLVATLGASKDHDWFHEPSQGWCYTEATLRDNFELPDHCPSNYGQYDQLLQELRNCSELRDSLADSYFRSGNNGMPWGRWDPQYQPVGVVKTRPS